ncbi:MULTISPECIES: TPM domain-containing protein [Myroides]|uniref:TPM domain-containing protein n=1 Tax=Myroides albus TaxID=2562892 RepID=A0A6I3LKF1_9FLAO|nr:MULTISPECIES: TPM domain-containing protein [Myroides]MTG99088.1 TPM domain-containing protein [Myroides albus]MVX36249.1 TPM domain-containing protein [Myroides sp. LoEW2-1]UVD80707.1 TPM domain-containing protein [Myroides albus]
MKNLFKKVFHSLTFAIIILLCQVNYAQFDIPKKPALKDQKLLYDYADLFSSQQQRELTDKLTHYSNETSTQILVIIIKSLNGENISLLGPKWGHEWGVGEKGKDNGVVILMSVQDRQIGIYPGYGAEQYITAGQGGELIRNRIIPHFKNGDYYGGIHTAVDGVTEMLKGVYKSDKKNTVRAEGDNETGGLFCLFAIIFVIVGTIIFNKGDKNNGGKGGGNKRNRSFLEDLATVIILSNSGSSSSSSSRGGWSSGGGGWSSGGGSSSGGGFGGFGGGGFSGGGSSGSW